MLFCVFCEFWSKVKQSEPYCSFKDSLQGFIKSWCFISVYQVSFKKFETGTIWVDLCCPVKNIWSNFVKKHIWFDQRCIFSTILTETQYEISSRVLICFSVPKSLLTKLYEGLSSLTHTFLSRVSYISFEGFYIFTFQEFYINFILWCSKVGIKNCIRDNTFESHYHFKKSIKFH